MLEPGPGNRAVIPAHPVCLIITHACHACQHVSAIYQEYEHGCEMDSPGAVKAAPVLPLAAEADAHDQG